MTDLNKERELYESVIEKTQGIKMEHLVGISFNEEKNQYEVTGEKWASELTDACLELNTGWFIWQECVKAKAQAVPETHLLVPKDKVRDLVAELELAFEDNLHLTISDLLPLQQDLKVILETSESGAEG